MLNKIENQINDAAVDTSKTVADPPAYLKEYFTRIGYTGEMSPTLETLKAIHLLHPQVIVFENLNPFLNMPVNLDIESLQQKLIHDGRGGYCFEQNTLFKHILETIGFKVKKSLGARVMWGRSENEKSPRTHMLLLVEIDQKIYLCDVGFGGAVLTAPLLFQPDIEQSTPHEAHRILKAGEEFILQINIQDTWKPVYSFGLEEQYHSDYEISNFYVANHPKSFFVNNLLVTAPTRAGRHSLFNNKLTTHYLNGDTEKKVLANTKEIRETLVNAFGIKLPENPELDTKLQKLLEAETETK